MMMMLDPENASSVFALKLPGYSELPPDPDIMRRHPPTCPRPPRSATARHGCSQISAAKMRARSVRALNAGALLHASTRKAECRFLSGSLDERCQGLAAAKRA